MTAAVIVAGSLLAAATPVDRESAREAARRELSKGIYHADDPSPFQRAVNAVLRWIGDRLDDATGAAPGGHLGLFAVLLVLAVIVAVVLWRVGPPRRTARADAVRVELSGPLSADEHRRRADGYAGQARYAEAVRERMRAIVRELEARGVLEPRAGRTADEVAAEAGVLLPAAAADLRAAARVFDEVWYGGRRATHASDAALRQADQRVQRAPLAVPVAGSAAGGFGMPR